MRISSRKKARGARKASTAATAAKTAAKTLKIREQTKFRMRKLRQKTVDSKRRHYENAIRSARRRKCENVDVGSEMMLIVAELLFRVEHPEWRTEIGLRNDDFCAFLEPIGAVQRLAFGPIVHVAVDSEDGVQWVLFHARDCRNKPRTATKKHSARERLVAVRADRVSIVPSAFPRGFEALSRVDQRGVLLEALCELIRSERNRNIWRPVGPHTKMARQRRAFRGKSARKS